MGCPTANHVASAGKQKRRISMPEQPQDGTVEDKLVLGVDLSTIVHMIISRGSIDLFRDIGKAVEEAETAAFADVFVVDVFVFRFSGFLRRLLAERSDLYFVADGPPPAKKAAKTKSKREARYKKSLEHLKALHFSYQEVIHTAGPLTDAQRASGTSMDTTQLAQACSSAVHKWTPHFVQQAMEILFSFDVPVVHARGNLPSCLVWLTVFAACSKEGVFPAQTLVLLQVKLSSAL